MEQKVATSTESSNEARDQKNADKKPRQWKKPTLEDVSEQIMAQPYIRFT